MHLSTCWTCRLPDVTDYVTDNVNRPTKRADFLTLFFSWIAVVPEARARLFKTGRPQRRLLYLFILPVFFLSFRRRARRLKPEGCNWLTNSSSTNLIYLCEHHTMLLVTFRLSNREKLSSKTCYCCTRPHRLALSLWRRGAWAIWPIKSRVSNSIRANQRWLWTNSKKRD